MTELYCKTSFINEKSEEILNKFGMTGEKDDVFLKIKLINSVDIFDNLFAIGYFESKKFWDILTISEIGITIYIIDDYVPKISDNIIFIPFTNISYISTIKHNDLNVMRQHYVEKNNQKK